LHHIKRRHHAFRLGIRTTFRPSAESSSFLAATAFRPMLLFVYTSSETPMPWPRQSAETFGSTLAPWPKLGQRIT